MPDSPWYPDIFSEQKIKIFFHDNFHMQIYAAEKCLEISCYSDKGLNVTVVDVGSLKYAPTVP